MKQFNNTNTDRYMLRKSKTKSFNAQQTGTAHRWTWSACENIEYNNNNKKNLHTVPEKQKSHRAPQTQ